MQVVIFNSQKDLSLSKKKSHIQKIVKWVLKEKKVFCDEIIFHFVTKKEIKKIHKQFFNDPTETDCITFPLDTGSKSGYKVLGEAFICPSVALDYGKEHNLNPYAELTLYIVHCILHMLGYDDIQKKEQVKMRKEEKRLLKALQQHGLTL